MAGRTSAASLSESTRDVTQASNRMKKKIIMLTQVLVSVFILAYLFNSIFEREASEELKVIATEPAATVDDLAAHLKLPPPTVQLLRSRCVAQHNGQLTLDLKQLGLADRAPIVWRVGPR